MNNLPFGIIFLFCFLCITCIITGILIVRRNKEIAGGSIHIKNIFLNIGLLILSGILFIIYEKLFNKIYVERWPSIFIGVIIIFYILFVNFIGLVYSIIYSKRLFITLLSYIVFIISTIIIYNLITNTSLGLLESNYGIFQYIPKIFFVLALITVGNIISYLIVKYIIKRFRKINKEFNG
uniref:Uncharacterized protein n=1 Tax=uncultured bacterium contig00021 TaxID=1181511 RepID=A0A806K288_9BACT|nr:hypothetical protein [uncultured bacterium contig00021]